MVMTEGSTRPFEGEPERGVDLKCDNGHEQRLYLRGMTPEMARHYAQLLDGTSPFYLKLPREDPHTFIGHCKEPGCGALFTATPFGYDAQQ